MRDGINEERPRETASTKMRNVISKHKRWHQQGEAGQTGESTRDSINMPRMSTATMFSSCFMLVNHKFIHCTTYTSTLVLITVVIMQFAIKHERSSTRLLHTGVHAIDLSVGRYSYIVSSMCLAHCTRYLHVWGVYLSGDLYCIHQS